MDWIKGHELTNALWAMASLNYTPPGLLSAMEAYVMSYRGNEPKWTVPMVASIFTRQDLANLAWAVAIFGEYPPQLIEIIYMGLSGIGDRPDPSYVQQAFGDTGTNKSQINSLLYLQIIMDLDLGRDANAFRPPDDFPGAWMTNSAISRTGGTPGDGFDGDDMLEKDSLEVNTSKTQNCVRNAFSRNGFVNVDEFALTMEDLVVEHGIQFFPYPSELLSIDFANPDSKIGVEVDGPSHFVTKIDEVGVALTSSVGSFEPRKGKLGYQFKWNAHDQEVNGSTALKKRMLEKLGWTIINVPFWDWNQVNADTEAEDEFCRSLLDGVSNKGEK
jgi:RAP domain